MQKQEKLWYIPHINIKINSVCIVDLNVKGETIKL